MRKLTTVLDVLGLVLLVAAGWLLAGPWLAALVAGMASLAASRALSGAGRPSLPRVVPMRRPGAGSAPAGRRAAA